MLFIKQGIWESDEKVKVWHVGEPMPEVDGITISFQADGDELLVLLSAMENAGRGLSNA